mmetsp:Transcript_22038/g.86660  ORF Transcript_22038/g.86660 Transcript_22038/m.86660 type:complete len:210 (+) Transcript_22038:806-1435(+)
MPRSTRRSAMTRVWTFGRTRQTPFSRRTSPTLQRELTARASLLGQRTLTLTRHRHTFLISIRGVTPATWFMTTDGEAQRLRFPTARCLCVAERRTTASTTVSSCTRKSRLRRGLFVVVLLFPLQRRQRRPPFQFRLLLRRLYRIRRLRPRLRRLRTRRRTLLRRAQQTHTRPPQPRAIRLHVPRLGPLLGRQPLHRAIPRQTLQQAPRP